MKKFKVAMICSIVGLFLFLMLIAGANSAKAGKEFHYGEIVDIQDNFITVKIEEPFPIEPDLDLGQRIELWIPQISNNPDPVVTPTIPECQVTNSC